MAVKDTLIAARDLIADPNHWCKGAFRDSGRYCAVGAVAKASGYWDRHARPEDIPDHWDSLAALRHELPSNFQPDGITNFNDHPLTHHGEIIGLFNRAIEAANA